MATMPISATGNPKANAPSGVTSTRAMISKLSALADSVFWCPAWRSPDFRRVRPGRLSRMGEVVLACALWTIERPECKLLPPSSSQSRNSTASGWAVLSDGVIRWKASVDRHRQFERRREAAGRESPRRSWKAVRARCLRPLAATSKAIREVSKCRPRPLSMSPRTPDRIQPQAPSLS